MAETRDQLKQHLEALEEFEPKYRAYIAERKRPPGDEVHLSFTRSAPAEVNTGGWTEAEMETRKSELLELAPAVDEALTAANVERPALAHPNGSPMALGVTSLLFYHGPVRLDESGFAMPTVILEKVVAAKGALKTKLKRRPTSPIGEAIRRRAQEPKPPGNLVPAQEAAARQRARDEETEPPQKPGWWKPAARWVGEQIWLLVILVIAAVIGGLILLHLSHQNGGSANSTTRHHVEVNEVSPP